MQRGLPVVIMRQWEPELACQLIERHRVTIAYILVTPLIQLMESGAHRRYDLTALSRVLTAAAKYTPEFVASVMAALEIEKFFFMYGLTEASPIVSTTEFSAQMIVKPNTLGFPVWYCDVRIVDDAGNELPRGEVGEIVVRGPNVFQGYYKRPEANKDVLRNGWLHTGDLGYMDDENFMFFVDRKKDMIKSGGENVYSLEVELAIGRLVPELSEVSIVGVPDEIWGEAVTAFAVLRPGEAVTAEEVVARARKELAGYKLPKAVHFVDELPKNVSGKVLKRQLLQDLLDSEN
ncbi:MAG: AMP-binding protein [Paracoccaceae bacterium]